MRIAVVDEIGQGEPRVAASSHARGHGLAQPVREFGGRLSAVIRVTALQIG